MASNMNKVAKELKNAINASDERKPKPYDTQAEVVRIEDKTAWVHIPGGVEETPVRLTINAKEGDMVNIHIANGSAWITGNGTNPPTDDTRAEQVYEAAGQSIDYVAQLVDKDITVKSISAATGYIDDLYSKNIYTDNIAAATGYIGDLYSKNIHTDNIEAATGYIHDLTADNITAGDIVADHATIDSLDTHYAQIDIANVNNAWIEHGTIKKAEVFDENVFDLSGNRATLSRIDASKINVANLRADNLIVRRINGQPVVGGYTLIDSNSPGYSSKNPQALGWYEFVNAQWVLSTDTTVDMTKAYYQEGNEVSLYDQAYIDGLENDLQQQIDGAVETYTGTVVPTLVNKPYTDWYDTSVTPIHDERAKHVGDIYYVVNSAASENGYCYRFAYDNTSHAYSWVLIKDSDVTKALGDISELKTFESNTTSWIDETDEGLETIRTNHTTLAGVVDKTVKESIQLWYTKANTTAPNKPTAEVTSTSTAGNAWRKVVPAYNASYPNYYYCWQYKLVDGSFAWSDVVRDIAMGETQGTARDAKNTADLALPAADFQVFETTTFTDLVDEVDEQSTTMTNMTTRLGLNSDGTGSTTDIVAKESALEQTVDTISTRVGKTETHLIGMYATCSTAEATKAKVATIVPEIPSSATWELTQGTTVTVKFTTANTHATPTLNVNGTGAKNIKSYNNTSLEPDEYKWPAGSTFTFTYNGTNWLMQDSTVAVRMSSAETSITQNAEAIVSEAISRESAVNILLDSDAPNLGAVYASANRYISDASPTSEYVTANNVELTDPPEQGIKYARRFVCNGTNTTSVGRAYAFYNTSENIIPYVPNTTYTATWWARCTNGQGQTNCHYPKFDGTTTNNASERITLTSEWQKFTVVFTTGSTPNTNYNRIWFYARFPANTSGTIDICGCKLVAGDAVEAYSTKIEQTANNVLIQATASDRTAAQGGQHLIQSLINVAPSGVTIDASKVNITGVITAINNDTTTTIDGGKIAANSITASKMVLADYNNYITVTENDVSSLISQNSEISNGWIYKNNATDSNTWLSPVLNQWATAGEKYRITGKLKMSAAGKCYVRIMARDADGAYKAGVATETIDVGTTETDLNSVVTIPSSFSTYPKVNIGIYFYAVESGSNVYKTGYCKQMKCERMSGGSLIVDGSITSDHISSNKIDANKINVGQIQIGDLSGSIGGVNLLTNDKVRKTGSSNGITFSTSSAGPEYIKINGTATANVDQWVADLQNITVTGMSVTISANTVFTNSTGIYFFVSTTKDGALYKNYKQITYYSATERRLTIDLESGETLRFIRISVPSGKTINNGNYRFKVETGNKQTAWTAAEDAYITDNGNDGIKIHSSLTKDNAIVLSSTGMEIFKGGDTSDYSIAKYGDTVRIGKDANQHVYIGPGSFSIGKGANNARQYMNVSIMNGHTPGGTEITGAYYAFSLMGPDVDPPSDSLFGFVLGYLCEATGFCAKSMGAGTVVHYDYQTAIGKYNANDSGNAFEIGWGTSSSNTKNIFEVDVGGNVNIASSRAYKVNGTVVASARAKTTITPTATGVSNYSSYGNSYYEKAGNVVHVHVGVKGVPTNTITAIATLPSGYRPTSMVFGHGTGGTSNNIGYMDISTAGVIQVRSETGYIGADVTYLV